MKRTHSEFKVQRPAKAALFLALIAILAVQCQRPEQEIGLELQPEEELLSVFQTDTITLNVTTVKEDSLRTDELSSATLGNYFDPVFGVVKTSFYNQVRIASPDIDFGEGAVADSLEFTLIYSGAPYISAKDQVFEIYEVLEDMYLDSSYYSNQDLMIGTENLVHPDQGATKVSFSDPLVQGEDTLRNGIKIRMSNELADRFITAGAEVYDSNDDWLEYFKGIYVRSVSGEGAVLRFNILDSQTRMRLFYHNDTDTTFFDYNLNSLGATYNRFEHSYQGNLAPINNGEEVDGAVNAYIQAGAGVKTKITFPHIDALRADESRTINRAELIVPVPDHDSRYRKQVNLFVLTQNEDGEDVSVPDQSLLGVDVGGLYDEDLESYVFNVPRYMQQLLNGDQENTLLLVSSNSGVSVTRVVINGPEASMDDPSRNMRMVLTYSE